MFKKSGITISLILLFIFSNAQTSDSTSVKRYKPRNKTFCTYIVLGGLFQNINLGLENSNYYTITGSNTSLPMLNLKYIATQRHSIGLRLGLNFQNSATTKTDSILFRSSISATKTAHAIPLNPMYAGFMEDAVANNTKSFILVPFYEYHFKGSRRWDYYIGLEYMIRFQILSKSKNFETIHITNTNKDVVEYSYRNNKSFFLSNQGAIATMGVNYFVYPWLSIGTKISYSVQSGYTNLNSNDEKLLVNGADQTSTLLIPNTTKTTQSKTSASGFLNGGFGGFLFSFYL